MSRKGKIIYSDIEFYKLEDGQIHIFGGKAQGFKLFPSSWTPPFFLITLRASQEILDNTKLNGPRQIRKYIKENYGTQIEAHWKKLKLGKSDRIIVRTSARGESLFDRGKYKSIECKNEIEDIISKISNIFFDWKKDLHTKDYSREIAIIIQEFIPTVIRGHLSNERRVSHLRREWLIEQESSTYSSENSFHRFPVYKHRIPTQYIPEDIHCLTQKSINESLHHPATLIAFTKQRVHFEWIWDGKKIWIVQADHDPQTLGPNPREHEYNSVDKDSLNKLNILKLIYDCDCSNWDKALNVCLLKEHNLPTTNLWILDSVPQLKQLSKGIISGQLKEDITKLLISPVVIRTELKNDLDLKERQMLPRTHTLDHVDDVVDFLKTKSAFLIKEGCKLGQFSFLIHHYIPSTSSAYCYANPNLPQVRIDALWGIADGLSYYSHDTFEFDPDNEETLKERKRFKDIYLKPLSNGKWMPQKTGQPWDWQASIGHKDLFAIGSATRKFAQLVNSPVRMMWFVDIPEPTGNPRNLPWYYELSEVHSGIQAESREYFFIQNKFIIRTLDDIERCRNLIDSGKSFSSIHLYPEPMFIRETEFIERITVLCLELDIPVSLQGSVLQHAYYQLASKGVKIVCTEPLTVDEEGKIFGKLVRDKIPENIEKRGENVESSQITGDALLEKLREKIIEESHELYWAHDDEEIIEEIADLEEVLSSYISHRHIDKAKLQQVRERKLENKGGFDNGIILLETRELHLINFIENKKKKKKKKNNANTIKKYGAPEIARIKPIPERMNEPQVIPMERLGVSLIVRYEKEYISIELTKLTKKREAPITGMIQLDLPLSFKSLKRN